MTEETKPMQPHLEDDAIDIIALLKQIWNGRKLILKIVIVFTLFGLLIALLTKNYYTASTTIVPVTSEKAVGGNLSGLASLAGINLGGAGSAGGEISPELYPEIVNSIPYKLELLNTKLKIKGVDSLVTYKYYYKEIYNPGFLVGFKKYTIGLPGVILSALKSSDVEDNSTKYGDNKIINLSDEDYELIEFLEGQISLNVNAKEGFISLDVTLQEAEASAQLTLRAQELLQEYALKFKTQKSIEQLEFTEERFKEKEKEFNDKKIKLAYFQDRNNAINTALAKSRLLQLQADYDLAFTVYSELAKQVETQRLQVKKDTPIFTILKPVTIPNEKAGPSRAIILIGFIFLGFVVSIGYIYLKSFLKDFKKDWDKA